MAGAVAKSVYCTTYLNKQILPATILTLWVPCTCFWNFYIKCIFFLRRDLWSWTLWKILKYMKFVFSVCFYFPPGPWSPSIPTTFTSLMWPWCVKICLCRVHQIIQSDICFKLLTIDNKLFLCAEKINTVGLYFNLRALLIKYCFKIQLTLITIVKVKL